MAALLNIPGRPAETVYQEFPQSVFGARQILGRIHSPQQVVLRYLAMERRDQTAESVLSDKRENILIVHWQSRPVSHPARSCPDYLPDGCFAGASGH